jgi:hypothetical protein
MYLYTYTFPPPPTTSPLPTHPLIPIQVSNSKSKTKANTTNTCRNSSPYVRNSVSPSKKPCTPRRNRVRPKAHMLLFSHSTSYLPKINHTCTCPSIFFSSLRFGGEAIWIDNGGCGSSPASQGCTISESVMRMCFPPSSCAFCLHGGGWMGSRARCGCV